MCLATAASLPQKQNQIPLPSCFPDATLILNSKSKYLERIGCSKLKNIQVLGFRIYLNGSRKQLDKRCLVPNSWTKEPQNPGNVSALKSRPYFFSGEDLRQLLLDRDAVLTEDVYPSRFSLQILDALNETMYEEQGFRGNSANYYNPANSYIDQVLINLQLHYFLA